MKKNGFTLVELLAVIVILAIILVIAVPSVMSTINSARLSSMESSAKMLISAAEKDYAVRMATGESTIDEYDESSATSDEKCSAIADFNDDEYDTCEIALSAGKVNTLTLTGKENGKFDGYSCTKTSGGDLTCTD